MPWIDSGRSSTSPVSVHPPSPSTSRPRSCSIRTYSWAYSGLPSARSSSACCTSAGSSAWSSSAATSRAVSSSESGVSEIVLAFVFPPPHARSSLEQLRPGGADDQQRHRAGPVSEQVDEVQQGVVGPVDVLEHEHRRAVLGQRLEEPPPRRKRLHPTALTAAGARPPSPTSGRRCRTTQLAIPLVHDQRRDRLARASPPRPAPSRIPGSPPAP